MSASGTMIRGDDNPQLFVLVLCDEGTGAAIRPATESDLAGLDTAGCASGASPRPAPHQHRQMSLQEILASRAAMGGPSCSHCGVTGEGRATRPARDCARTSCQTGPGIQGRTPLNHQRNPLPSPSQSLRSGGVALHISRCCAMPAAPDTGEAVGRWCIHFEWSKPGIFSQPAGRLSPVFSRAFASGPAHPHCDAPRPDFVAGGPISSCPCTPPLLRGSGRRPPPLAATPPPRRTRASRPSSSRVSSVPRRDGPLPRVTPRPALGQCPATLANGLGPTPATGPGSPGAGHPHAPRAPPSLRTSIAPSLFPTTLVPLLQLTAGAPRPAPRGTSFVPARHVAWPPPPPSVLSMYVLLCPGEVLPVFPSPIACLAILPILCAPPRKGD